MVFIPGSTERPRCFDSRQVLAGAKVNLYLKILDRREDGLHNIESLFVPVTFPRDVLTLDPLPAGQGLRLSCNWKELESGDNILARTYALFGEQTGRWPSLAVHLEKQIPMEAGLGGGSSDAAALLKALFELEDLDFSLEQLVDVARRIGSDVPFFISAVPAWVEGAGEQITPVNVDLDGLRMLVIRPDVRISTKEAYQAWDEASTLSIGHSGRDLTGHRFQHRKSFCSSGRCLMNSFENVVFDLCPEVGKLKKVLLEAGADGVVLSGSGSALVAVSRSDQKLQALIGYCEKHEIAYFISEASSAPNQSWGVAKR